MMTSTTFSVSNIKTKDNVQKEILVSLNFKNNRYRNFSINYIAVYWLGKTMKGDNALFYRFSSYLTGLCTKRGSQPSTNFIDTETKLIKIQ